MKPVYSDTDSCFIVGATKEEFRAFVDKCNTEIYPKLLAAYGCTNSRVKLDTDKQLEFVVFTAKKRYAGRFAGSGKPAIKGLEYMRGDVCKLAANLQKAVVDLFVTGNFEPEDYHIVITEHRNRILHDELPLELISLAEALSKDVDEYDVTSPAVTVAKILRDRGESTDGKLAYVVIDGSVSPMKVIPVSDFTGVFDRAWLWESACWPATERFLEAAFPDHDWKPWAKVRVKAKMCAEAKLQAILERKGQRRLFPGY
jgi:DNA polymerase elongation subunit (family B)